MFALKFHKFSKDGSSFQTSISCPNYSVHQKADGGITITTYNTMLDVDGVERHVYGVDEICPANAVFDNCFIENDKGKTIDHIKPN